jgi:hypothetical protein
VIFLSDFSFVRIFLRNYHVTMTTTLEFRYFMFGKYNGFVSKARVSACMYFLVLCLKFIKYRGRGSPTMGGHPHWSQKYGGLSCMNSRHWLVQFKVCIITTAWRQRNSISWLINFLQIYFFFARIFARFCKFQKLSPKETAKESAKRREPTLTKVSLF